MFTTIRDAETAVDQLNDTLKKLKKEKLGLKKATIHLKNMCPKDAFSNTNIWFFEGGKRTNF